MSEQKLHELIARMRKAVEWQKRIGPGVVSGWADEFEAALAASGARQCSYCGASCVPNVTACKDCAAKYLIADGVQMQQVGFARAELSEEQMRKIISLPEIYDSYTANINWANVAMRLNALLRSQPISGAHD